MGSIVSRSAGSVATDQLIALWHRQREIASAVPDRAQFEFGDFGRSVAWIFATELVDGPTPILRVRLFGSALDKLFGKNLTDLDLIDATPPDRSAYLVERHRACWAEGRPHVEDDWPGITGSGATVRVRWAIVPVRRPASQTPYFLGAVDPLDGGTEVSGSPF